MNMCVRTLLLLLSHSVVSDCDPMDCSPPGSSVHGILQERMLEWVPMPSSRRGLPDPGIKLGSPALQADSLPSEPKWEKNLKENTHITFLYA